MSTHRKFFHSATRLFALFGAAGNAAAAAEFGRRPATARSRRWASTPSSIGRSAAEARPSANWRTGTRMT